MLTKKIGDTFRKVIKLTDAETGRVVNLTGYAAYADIKADANPSTAVTASAACTVDAALGRVTAAWTDEQTALITPGNYVYDIRVVSGDGEVTTIFGEPVRFVYAVTEIGGGE